MGIVYVRASDETAETARRSIQIRNFSAEINDKFVDGCD